MKMHIPPGIKDYNFKKITVISIIALLFGIIFGFFLFPVLLKKLLTSVSFYSLSYSCTVYGVGTQEYYWCLLLFLSDFYEFVYIALTGYSAFMAFITISI